MFFGRSDRNQKRYPLSGLVLGFGSLSAVMRRSRVLLLVPVAAARKDKDISNVAGAGVVWAGAVRAILSSFEPICSTLAVRVSSMVCRLIR